METVRVNVLYRPLRIAWAIASGDIAAFREAVRNNHALWGGRYNPIVIVDQDEGARTTLDAYKVDLVVPLGDSPQVNQFAASVEHLPWPFFQRGIFSEERGGRGGPVLDIGAAIDSSRSTPEWAQIQQSSPRIYRWSDDDALRDVFLIQLGAYPDPEVIGTDYEPMFKEAFDATETTIARNGPLPADLFDHPSIAYLSRHRLQERSNQLPTFYHGPGFYVGDASDLVDLVTFWNLRAANLTLLFVDQAAHERYASLIPAWRTLNNDGIAEPTGQLYPVWHGHAARTIADLSVILGDGVYRACPSPYPSSQHGRIPAPTMHFGHADTLGVIVADGERVKVSFSFPDRPCASARPLFAQHLVASVSFSSGMFGRDDIVFAPPYVPELNPFYSRQMIFFPHHLRIEPRGVGIIVDCAASDGAITALPTAELLKRIFELARFGTNISSGGLIARQMISQLGGLQGSRVFKIPGVRTLLKTHGPSGSFSKRSALQLIPKNTENPGIKFSEYADLFIEYRPDGEELTPESVFSYLVRKGLFRIGHDLECPHCQLNNWFAVDDLRQRVNCQMCGTVFDATAQLIGGEWAYRRSGVLGTERNAQGAIPVVLTLQQLETTLYGFYSRRGIFSVSLDLTPLRDPQRQNCEIDFALLLAQPDGHRTTVVIGECKDRGYSPTHGGDGGTINANDIENLRYVADAFPKERFQVYIVLSKLCPFTASEIELARSLNSDHLERVIMLTDRELEPYFVFDRTSRTFDIPEHAVAVEDLARATVSIYFEPHLRNSAPGSAAG